MSLNSVFARSIYDSRGNPTVEVDIKVNDYGIFRAAVPSGASTGVHEAVELRDGDKKYNLGKGVNKAVSNVNDIIGPALLAQNFNVTQQREIDEFMCRLDGTPNKSNLGANSILGVSIAICKAAAVVKGIPLYKYIASLAGYSTVILPVPSFNVINGGSHAGNRLAMQEFMIMPTGASSFREAMRIGSEVYHSLKGLIKQKYGIDACNVGDEGGFAPNIQSNQEALDLLIDAINIAGYNDVISIAMDVAASEFLKNGKYQLDFKNSNAGNDTLFTPEQLNSFYVEIISKYPQIVSIEDPFGEDEFESFKNLTSSTSIQIVGDDLTVTTTGRIQKAIDCGACNALLVKLNQIGTVTETIESCLMARDANWGIMVSHRSGETEDNFIADFSVGICAGQIKTGAPCRSERLAKYNQLLRIEEELGSSATYAGLNFRRPSI